MALNPFFGPWQIFQSAELFRWGTPRRKATTYIHTNTVEMHKIQTSMSRAGF
jgi:hypothetical protein